MFIITTTTTTTSLPHLRTSWPVTVSCQHWKGLPKANILTLYIKYDLSFSHLK
jgi:hypothetical protein